jgi:predicted AAA+ superfamily ATPase
MSQQLIPRAVADSILEALRDTPAVVLNGPRQAGKTTLVRSLVYPGRVEVVTLDDQPTRQAARFDPRAFVERQVDTLVIDEAQLEPGLFRAIKASIDRDRRPGRFLLTGSSRLLAAPGMADALVGRVDTIELWPFAERELTGAHNPSFVDAIFDNPGPLLRTAKLTRADIVERVLRGGFPEAARRPPRRRRDWFESYVRTTIEGVVQELAHLERLAEMPRLLRLCAARTATELNVSSIASDLGIPLRTTSGYLARLETAFLIRLIPAWSTNLSAKVARRPKLFLVDVALAAHLQGATATVLERTGAPLGPLVETLVATELVRQLSWSSTRATLWHFRDRSGVEVDLVLEHPDGRVVGIEVKATSTPRVEDLRGLRFLATRLGDRFTYGCLLTAAPEATPFGPRMAALPLSTLWDPISID